jgi:RimJ/RimL family protein N-acetyltransferase
VLAIWDIRSELMELHGDHLVLTSVTIEEAPVLLPAFNGDEQFNQWSGHASDLTLAQVHADMLGTLNQPGGVVWRLADQTETLVGVAKTALLPSPGTAWIDLLVIRRAFQGRGYGSEAATLLETHLFSSLLFSRDWADSTCCYDPEYPSHSFLGEARLCAWSTLSRQRR